MMPYKSSTQKAAMKKEKEYKLYKIYIKRQNGRSPSLSVITLYIKIFKLSNKKADEQIRFFFLNDPPVCCLQEIQFRCKDTIQIENEGI